MFCFYNYESFCVFSFFAVCKNSLLKHERVCDKPHHVSYRLFIETSHTFVGLRGNHVTRPVYMQNAALKVNSYALLLSSFMIDAFVTKRADFLFSNLC